MPTRKGHALTYAAYRIAVYQLECRLALASLENIDKKWGAGDPGRLQSQ